MRRRRNSVDSETSTDSWSVIQRSVGSYEPSSHDEIESSLDSEHWNSDSEDLQVNGESGNDSLEEFEESQATEDETADCEIVDEDEALQMSCSRYYISAEKIYKSLDLLDAQQCCTNFTTLLPCLFPLSRDATRAMAMLFIAASAAILFAKGVRLSELHVAQRPHEVIAPGQQSRESFERAFTPLLRSRTSFNISGTCKRWLKPTRSSTSSWSTPSQSVKMVPLIVNSTSSFLKVDEVDFFTRPLRTAARISISRSLRRQSNVCRQKNNGLHQNRSIQTRWTLKRPDIGTARHLHAPIQNQGDLLHMHIRIHDVPLVSVEPSPLTATPLSIEPSPHAVTPVSISRTPKADLNVCTTQIMKHNKLLSFSGTDPTRAKANPLKKRHPTIIQNKSPPHGIKDFILLSSVSKRPSHSKRRQVAPCVPIQRPCVERNKTTKPRKVSNFVLAKSPTRQLATFKRQPLAPSQPLVNTPCMDEKDFVKCWKSIQYDQETKSHHGSAQKRFDDLFIR